MSSPRGIVAWISKCSLCHSRESGNPVKHIKNFLYAYFVKGIILSNIKGYFSRCLLSQEEHSIYLWLLLEDFALLVGVLDGVNELLFIKTVGLCCFILLIICCCLRVFIFCFPAILID
ncbi:hypothetical protein JRD95_00964 [Rickettsia parkeri]|nr:hypothetical protein JRD95_00964 [Rickettsia parkeri]